ncbi:MAG: hypothetical protein QXY42_01955 [Candidatus Bathyarchaeia archaeon]
MRNKSIRLLLTLITISSLLHLFFIYIYPEGFDLKTWGIVGRAIASGGDFYCKALASGHPFAYPPLFAQTIISPLTLLVHPDNEFAFLLILRLVFLAFNMGTGILLWEMLGPRKLLAALWFLNPLIMGVAQYQFDGIPAFFLLLAIRTLRRSAVASSWLLGIAASLKIYPGLLMPIVIGRAKGLRGISVASLAAISVPLLSAAPFLESDCFWRSLLMHIELGFWIDTTRRYVFPMVYAALLLLTFKLRLDLIGSGIMILSSFHFLFHIFLYHTFSAFYSVHYAISLLPLLLLHMAQLGSRSGRYLAYNAVWTSALAARYKTAIYKHIPMPIPFEAFDQLSFYAFMASLAATCVVALLESLRAPRELTPSRAF